MLNTTTTWSVRSKNGDESHSYEPFHFKARDQVVLGLRRLGCGDHRSGNHDEQYGNGGQHMEANPIVDASGQRCASKGELSAPMEDEVLAEQERKRVQLLKGDSAHQHGDTNGQTTSRTQQP